MPKHSSECLRQKIKMVKVTTKKKQKDNATILFNTIAIIGVGLIGGSIGLAVKKRKLADRVIGIGRSKLSLQKALKRKAVDEITLDKSKVKNAELIILSTPVKKIVPLIKELMPYLKKGTIITDVGSSKTALMKNINKFLPGEISFIGGHPLAGSEKKGVMFADADLFEKCICFLIPNSTGAKKTFEKVKNFWKRLGARPVIISSEEHDFIVAGVSHLPHIVAVALVNSLSNVKCRGKKITKFSGQGWKDTTRISGGSSEVWGDIFSSNREKLLLFMDRFGKEYDKIKKNLKRKDFRGLHKILKQASEKSSHN